MEPAMTIGVLWLAFAGTHIGLATVPVRRALVARLGEGGFTLLFYAVAAVSFSLAIHFYANHRFEGAAGLGLAGVPGLRAPLLVAAAAGVALAVAGVLVFSSSPMARFREGYGGPRGLARITRHSFLVGVALAGAAHALLATRLVGTVFFTGLALFAVLGAWHQDRKLIAIRGRPYADYVAATSTLPFGAMLAGRGPSGAVELWATAAPLAIGLAVTGALRTVHGAILEHGGAWVIGVFVGGAALLEIESWLRARRSAASRATSDAETSAWRRRALATAGAVLVAHVGLVHEVVGAKLYPDGPAFFGGALGWNAAGVLGIALGIAMAAGALEFAAVPLVPLATVAIAAGAVCVVGEALQHGGFHFFAATLVAAGALVAAAGRAPSASRTRAVRPLGTEAWVRDDRA
jgi:uncharacterized membrane protein